MQSFQLEPETLRKLADLSPQERRQKLYLFYLLGKIPNKRLLETHDRFEAILAPGDTGAWLPFSRPDPTTHLREVLNVKRTEKQIQYGCDIVTPDQESIHQSVLNYKRTAVKSCNGGGKTWVGGEVALWALDRGFRTLITASTKDQADAGVGAEIQRFRSKATPGMGGLWMPSEIKGGFSKLHELVTFSVDIGTEEEIAGSAAGRHYDRMCLIIDEANSVNRKLLEQADRICLGPHDIILALFNPTPPTCYIREAIATVDQWGNPLWNVVTIDGENHPNVLHNDPDIYPGSITREMIADQFAKAGGNPKHFMFAPPVKGEWADSSSDSLIKREWVLKSYQRWRENARKPDYRGTALALDIAGTGGDASSMLGMKDFRVFRPIIPEDFCRKMTTKADMPSLRPGPTWMRGREVQDSVDMCMGALHTVPDVRVLTLDAGGLGDGPTSQLQALRNKPTFPKYLKHIRDERLIQKTVEEKAIIIGHKFGESPAAGIGHRFKKFKDQILWNLARGLEEDRLDLPPPEVWRGYNTPEAKLEDELLRPFFGLDDKDHLIIVDKRTAETGPDENMKKRAKQMPTESPNELHALALVFWEFCRLSPGMKPIEDNRELRTLELAKLAKQAVREHAGKPLKKRRGALPWHLR